MKINTKLNLVCPIETEDGEVHFHSKPIMRETFEKYHIVIARTFTSLLSQGLDITGAKVAAMHLKEMAIEMGVWEGVEGVENGLLEEITRLTNVIVPTEQGWKTLPVSVAISKGHIAEDDWWEAKQRIVFFILISAMSKPKVTLSYLSGMCRIWQTVTTSLTDMEYLGSLPTSTETVILPTNTSLLPS